MNNNGTSAINKSATETRLVCQVCHGKRYTTDTGRSKHRCGACEYERTMDYWPYRIKYK
jgi:ribosomal protein L37E